MEPKLFGVAAAGLVAGLALARLMPSSSAPAPAADTPAPGASPTPFACVRDAESVDAELAKHRGRVLVLVNWHPSYGVPWLPTFERLRAGYKDRGVDFVGVLASREKLDEICRDQRLRWPQIVATWDATWTALFAGQNMVVVGRDGEVVHRGYVDPNIVTAIDSTLQGDPRPINGRVLHRGRPIAGFSDLDPKLEIRTAFGWSVEPEPVEYFRATGSFVAKLSPGTYYANVDVGREYFGSATFGVTDFPDETPVTVDVLQAIHLTSPIDSRVPQGDWGAPAPFHTSPVRIAWDAIPGVERYQVSIWGSNVSETLEPKAGETQLDVPLAPGEYNLQMSALDTARTTIGGSRFRYDEWPSASYRFRVPPK